MKYKILGVIAIVLFGMTTSCTNFLNVTPRNKKVVRNVEDQRDILASYMYFIKTYNRDQIKIMGVDYYAYPKFNLSSILSLYTGENHMAPFSFLYNSQTNKYTSAGYEKLAWLEKNFDVWNRYYAFLGPINMLIKSIDGMNGDDPALKDLVKGEALAWRAFAYFKLLQYYSPYHDVDLGIPIYEDPSDDVGNAMPERQTQKYVFNYVLNDCKTVLSLLERTPYTDWNFFYREDLVHALMASVYCWKALSASSETSDWENAEKHARIAIGTRKLASSSEDLKRIFDCSPDVITVPVNSSEFFVRITDKSGYVFDSDAYRLCYLGTGMSDGNANMEFYNMYEDNDRRKSFYFYKDDTGGVKNDKYNLSGVAPDENYSGCFMPFRLAEMFLIRAEALCRTGRTSKAVEVIDEFRKSRYDNPKDVSGTDEEILNLVLAERKKEFLLENDFLWLDMKRLGATMTRTVNGEKVELKSDDFRYTFPIPAREMIENKKMKQNPEWNKYI